jgi:hypothetical protein
LNFVLPAVPVRQWVLSLPFQFVGAELGITTVLHTWARDVLKNRS